jgi:hypothetical protein
VKENWRYSGAEDDWGCVVFLLQDKNGNVKEITLKSCIPAFSFPPVWLFL